MPRFRQVWATEISISQISQRHAPRWWTADMAIIVVIVSFLGWYVGGMITFSGIIPLSFTTVGAWSVCAVIFPIAMAAIPFRRRG